MKKDSSETHQGETPTLEIVQFPNGTYSLRDSRVDQTMHSRVGPAQESRIIYAESAKVSHRLAAQGTCVVWDVGMGTGANVIATLEEVVRNAEKAAEGPSEQGEWHLQVESFETSIEGVVLALEHRLAFPTLQPWRDHLEQLIKNRSVQFKLSAGARGVHVHWRLWQGDFYENFENAITADVIYFDFYSPTAVPDLWTQEKFACLRKRLGNHATDLFTYSAATPTRLAILLGGFYVGYGVRTPAKSESTVASTLYKNLTHPLDGKWLRKLDVSTSVQDLNVREQGRRHDQWNKIQKSENVQTQ